MTEPITATGPTPAEIAAALQVLCRAYTPEEFTDDDADYDPWNDNGCDCGSRGRDDDFEGTYCNCGDGCSCASCLSWLHRLLTVCIVRDCGRPTRLRLVRERISTALVSADDDDPQCGDKGFAEFADQVVSAGPDRHVCGSVHARQVIADHAGDGVVWRVRAYRWQPETYDLRDATAHVVRAAQGASHLADAFGAADFHGKPKEVGWYAESLRRDLVAALHGLALYEVERRADPAEAGGDQFVLTGAAADSIRQQLGR